MTTGLASILTAPVLWVTLAGVVLAAIGIAQVRSVFATRSVPDLPCPVCGAEDRNCYGQVTSACGQRRSHDGSAR